MSTFYSIICKYLITCEQQYSICNKAMNQIVKTGWYNYKITLKKQNICE